MLDPGITNPSNPTRDFEVWVSQALGVPLTAVQHNFKKPDESRQTEI
jgi:hypothetical protein